MKEKVIFSVTLKQTIEYDTETGTIIAESGNRLDFAGDSEIIAVACFDENKQLSAIGASLFNTMLVQSMTGCIKLQHDKGFKNDAQNLRDIISQLEENFISTNVKVHTIEKK